MTTRSVIAFAAMALLLSAGCARRSPAAVPAATPSAAGAAQAPVSVEGEPGAPAFVPVPSSEMPQVHLDSGSEETGPYEVQVGDTLEVSVYGDTDLTRQVPVRPDGMISYTFVGDIRAAGRSVQEIREDIQKKLSAFLRSPEVTVIATDFSKPKVYVGGEIRQPGVFLLAPRQDTLLDAVYLAGLPTDKADVTNAVLVRDGRVVDVDFTDLLRGDLSANIKLHDNDLVYIPEAAERYIYVLGEVRRPQALETTIPLSMINVLAQSGGMDPSYAKVTEIAVLRGGLKEPRVAVVNYKRLLEGDFSQNIQVKPGDIVYVPTTGLGKYSRVIEQILRTFSLLFQWRLVAQGF